MMLPSTGRFKELNCPFYNSTLCERPYCHFRHVRRDPSEGSSVPGSTSLLQNDGDILQHLVSEAVRKVLERTEILPSALTSTNAIHQVEGVSSSLVNRVVEELTPPLTICSSPQRSDNGSSSGNAFSVQPKIPSYKPTPISLLKRRHIPIPYSPSLAKNSSIFRKRANSDEAVSVKKFRCEPQVSNGYVTDKPPVSSLPSRTETPSNLGNELSSAINACEVAQYSPTPVGGWKSSSVSSYTPSSIESLSSKHSTYVPSSRTSVQSSSVSYEPSDKSVSAVEPCYEPVTTNGLRVKETYKPSTVSNSEPEYQPAFSDVNAKDYIPTDISKLQSSDLGLSTELLQDILQKDFTGGESEDGNEHSVVLKSGSDTLFDVIDNQVEFDSEKTKSEISARKIDGKSSKELEKKKSDSGSGSSKKRSDDKKRDESKRREKTEKKADEGRKKREEKSKGSSEKKESSEVKKDSEKKKKRDVDKKKSSESKKEDSAKRRGSDDQRNSDSKKKKHSESVKKNEDSQKSYTEKISDSNKKHSDGERRAESDQKRDSEKKLHSNADRHHKLSSKRREHKKKNSDHESTKSHSSHKKDSLTSPKAEHKQKLSESQDREKNLKMKLDSKHSNDEDQKRNDFCDEFLAEIIQGGAVTDNDSADAMNDVLFPEESWASSSDEDAITKECLRIFQEYDPSVAPKKVPSYKPPQPVGENDLQVPKKKRVAHEGAESTKLLRKSPTKRPRSLNPSLALAERFRKVKEAARSASTSTATTLSAGVPTIGTDNFYSNKQTSVTETKGVSTQTRVTPLGVSTQTHATPLGVSTQTQMTPFSSGGKVRIAHVPNVNILLNAKMKMQQQLKERQQSIVNRYIPSTSTIPQTVAKGVQRVAHMPSDHTLSRPVICDIGGKIPTNVRQKYLNMLVDEYKKICSDEQEACEKAQEEELNIHSRSTTRNLYVSHVSNTISRLRKSAAGGSSKANEFRPVANRIVSHTSVLAGKGGTKGSWSIEKPRKPPSSITVKTLYEQFTQFMLTEQQLKDNGFPMAHPEERGLAEIHAFFKQPFRPSTPDQRMCSRCSQIYYVNRHGFSVKDEQCIYHWGRLFQSKTRGGWEARYNCCQGPAEAIGCSVGSCHVSDNFDANNLRGYVRTLPRENPPPDGNYGIYALDCEMCYTTVGLELTRVTVINSELNVVYETLVKPENPILDYNTRFSGIKEEDLEGVTTSIYEVQSVLLSFINDKSIIVGHSLESDFKALKLIHGSVVDTSVVYPHKMGPPKKRALKSLCRELLRKIIQESEGGHDSAEDAKAAMEVMLFKIKEEAKNW